MGQRSRRRGAVIDMDALSVGEIRRGRTSDVQGGFEAGDKNGGVLVSKAAEVEEHADPEQSRA